MLKESVGMNCNGRNNTMATKIQVHVDDLTAMGKRFVDAWHRAQAGEPVDEAHVTFLSFQAMTETLSPRRLELLRFVRQHGAASVRELAASLGRDYKNVHQDVNALEAGGLLLREGRRLSAPWNEVQASINLAPV
jgi:predicted transcriptional regulator